MRFFVGDAAVGCCGQRCGGVFLALFLLVVCLRDAVVVGQALMSNGGVYGDWSQWGVCQTNCRQMQRRVCQVPGEGGHCTGESSRWRPCYTGMCRTTVDVLQQSRFVEYPDVVERVRSQHFCRIQDTKQKPRGYRMWKPTAKKTSVNFNVDGDAVSVLTTFKLPEITTTDDTRDVYLFRLHYGESWFGVRLGTEVRVDYFDKKRLTTTSFQRNLFDGTWHRVGIQIVDKFASLYVDCRLIGTSLIGGSFNVFPTSVGSLEFGMNPDDSKAGVVGIIEELFIHFR